MKNKISDYREGAMGALLDEYEKALNEILVLTSDITQGNFEKVIDPDTEDPDCKSVQTIMNHVINAGYGYCYYIRKRNGEKIDRFSIPIKTVDGLEEAANKMFEYVIETSNSLDQEALKEEEIWSSFIFKAPWSGIYDLEQIYEHAIVHILRHRRQIEKFKLLM